MVRQIARLILIVILFGLLIQSVALANLPGSQMAVQCWEFDPNFPTAVGELVFDSKSNSLTLVLDFTDAPMPGGPLPGTRVTFGHLSMSCDQAFTTPVHYETFFSGETGMYGWDFETMFTHVLPLSPPGGTESCFNPRIDDLSFQLEGLFYTCGAGLMGTYDPFMPN